MSDISDIAAESFSAVMIPAGVGAAFDLSRNTDLHRLIAAFVAQNNILFF